MLDYLEKTWTDSTLYGHCLTTLPSTMWNFATSSKLVTYTEPDPGTAERFFGVFEKYVKTEDFSNGGVIFGTNVLPLKYTEIAFRRIVGTVLIVGATVAAAPLGFAIKVIQTTFV